MNNSNRWFRDGGLRRLWFRRSSGTARSSVPLRSIVRGISGEDENLVAELRARFEQLRLAQLAQQSASIRPPAPLSESENHLSHSTTHHQTPEEKEKEQQQQQQQQQRQQENRAGPKRTKSVHSIQSVQYIGAYRVGILRPHTPDTLVRMEDNNNNNHGNGNGGSSEPPSSSSSPRELLHSGDVFILDDLPADFTIGCDSVSFRSAEPCRGFRDIPPGPHFIWVSPLESTSSRCGYWIYTPEKKPGKKDSEPGQVYIKQWTNFNEALDEPTSLAEARFQQQQLAQTYNSLLPFLLRQPGNGIAASTTATTLFSSPAQQQQQQQQQLVLSQNGRSSSSSNRPADRLTNENMWYQLTSAITPGVLNRITGKEQKSWRVTTMDGVAGDASMASEARLYGTFGAASELRFIFPMDALLINPSATGTERTRQALDPTGWVIRKLEGGGSRHNNDDRDLQLQLDDLVGEFQFAFLTGMHLGNQACIDQWFFLTTRLVLRSFDLITQRPRLARALLQTLHAQLLYHEQYLSGDVLFDLVRDSRHRLRVALITYRSRLDEKLRGLRVRFSSELEAVRTAFTSLESYLKKIGWDLESSYVRSGNVMLEDGEVVELGLDDFEDEDERGEFAPAVVHLEDGRETGSY